MPASNFPFTIDLPADTLQSNHDTVYMKWLFVNGPSIPTIADPTKPASQITFSGPGIYTLNAQTFWNDAFDCVSRDTYLTITISAPSPPAYAGVDVEQCAGTNTFNLDALDLASGENGSWTIDNTSGPTATFADNTDPNTTVTLDKPGRVQLRWTTLGPEPECPGNSDYLLLEWTANPNLDSLNTQQLYCDVENISLLGENISAIPSASVNWTHTGPGEPIISTPTAPETIIADLVPGIHNFTYTITNGACVVSDNIDIQIDEFIVADAGLDQTFCGGETLNLIGNDPSPGTSSWSLYSGVNSGSFSAPNASATDYGAILPDSTYIFEYVLENGACISKDYIQVVELQNAQFNVSVVEPICSGLGSIDVSVQGEGNPSLSYLWSNGATTQDLTDVSSGIYSLTITHPNGCSVVHPVSLSSNTSFNVEITEGPFICPDEFNTLTVAEPIGGVAPYSYLWSNGETTQSIQTESDSVLNLAVAVTDDLGCTVAETLEFIPFSEPNITFDDGLLPDCFALYEIDPFINPETFTDCSSYSFGFPTNSEQGWTGVSGDNSNWFSNNSLYGNPTTNPGPTYLYDGYYLRGFASTDGNNTIVLSPTLNLTNCPDAEFFKFQYFMFGSSVPENIGTLSLEISYDNGLTWETNPIWSKTGDQGNHWRIALVPIPAAAIGDTNVKLRLEYIGAGLSYVGFDEFSLVVADYTYQWSTGDDTRNIIVDPTITAEYFLTITDANGCVSTDSVAINSNTCHILNLELNYFNAQSEECNENVLRWETAFEQDFHAFFIERSFNSQDWKTIATINAKGNSEFPIAYQYLDEEAPLEAYYRLKYFHADGSYQFSEIIQQINDCREWKIYPNPTQNILHIEFFWTKPNTDIEIQILDTKGLLAWKGKTQFNQGANYLDLALNQLVSGVYLVKLTSENGSFFVKRFIKE